MKNRYLSGTHKSRKLILLLISCVPAFLSNLSAQVPASSPYKPAFLDPATGNIITSTGGTSINGHAISSGGSGLSGGTNGNVIKATGATTIGDSGIALSNLQTKTGTLALGGFGSITGRIASAQLPLAAQLYDNATTPLLAIDAGTRRLLGPTGTVVASWDGSNVNITQSITFQPTTSGHGGILLDNDEWQDSDGNDIALADATDNWRWTSSNGANYFNNSGFVGNGNGLTSLAQSNISGATTVGKALLSLANPSAITFPKFNADNTVTAENASTHRSSLGLGTAATQNTGTSGANVPLLNGANTFSGNTTVSGASFGLSGNISGAGIYGTSGIRYKNVAGTFTDTSSSGTVATAYGSVWGGNTWAASAATTLTDAFADYFKAPTAGTNVTFTNGPWALGADSLKVGTSNPVTISSSGAIAANGVAVPTISSTSTFTGKTIALGSNTVSGSTSDFNTALTGDDFAFVGAANTFTGANIISTSGAASAPALKLSGAPFAGTGTTSFPLLYLNDSTATASTTLSTSGTYLGVNGHGSADLMNLMVDGTSKLKVDSTGSITTLSTGSVSAPTYTLRASNTGIYSGNAAEIDFTIAGVSTHALATNGRFYSLSNTGPAIIMGASSDNSVGRAAPGVTELVSGSSLGGNGGTFRSTPTSPSQITADQNNYNPGGSSYYQRWNTDASRSITGLTFSTTQVSGQTHVIVNVGSFNIVLANESASSTAANRFHNSTGADITLAADQAADLFYDGTTARWRVYKRN